MKGLISLTMVLAFFVAIPQCFGQDADQSPAQLLTEQQLVQMFNLAMAPPKSCHQTICNPAIKMFLERPECKGQDGKACRTLAQVCRQDCNILCHGDPGGGNECKLGTGDCNEETGAFTCEREGG